MIYLVIEKSNDPGRPGTVFQAHRDHPGDRYGPRFEVKPWTGPVPPIHCVDDPDAEPIISYDPTWDNPDWSSMIQKRIDYDALADQADAEIDWLDAMIPQITTMNLEELRGVLLRMARQNRKTIKAWRYLFRRLG